ncbi:MAG: hypothetical protein K6G91_05620, partial [Kiritimatiellae bacterium]|nr:hypothetical protein [Kiritimatiellia bacterium]
VVFSGGSIYVRTSGFVYNTTIYGKGYVSAAGGRVFGASVKSSGSLDVFGWSSGGSTVYGYTSNVDILSGGQLVLGYFATGSDVRVSSGYVYVSSGGFLQEATIGSGVGAAMGAQVYIKPNGSGRLNRIYSNGIMTVSSAGTAALTKVFSGGSLVVSSGGSISGTVIGGSGLIGGRVELMPGAKATDTTIMSGGRMVADSSIISGTTQYAGTVSITLGWSDSGTISGGTAYLYGASSLNEKLLGGVMNVSRTDVNRGYVSNVTVQNATLYLNSGTYLDNATVSSGGKVYVYDGARASGVDVRTDGAAFIKNGGSMTGGSIYGSETVTSGGSVLGVSVLLLGKLEVDGNASNCTVASGGSVVVSSGGIFANGSMSSAAKITVASNGTATIAQTTGMSATISGGSMYVNSGTASFAELNKGILAIRPGAYLSNAYVSAGELTIHSGASASGAQVSAYNSAATLAICSTAILSSACVSGGSATVVVNYGGTVNKADIMFGANATVNGQLGSCVIYSGIVVVSSGGFVTNAMLANEAFLSIRNFASASDVAVSSGGFVTVSSGGSVMDATIYADGAMYISNGAVGTSGLTVMSSGWLQIANGGYANGIVVHSGGEMLTYGETLNVLVNDGGKAMVYAGSLFDLTAANGGSAICSAGRMDGKVSSGGVAVFAGGSTGNMSIAAGGKLSITKNLSMSGAARIDYASGGILDFDISGITSASDIPLFGNTNNINGGYDTYILNGEKAVHTLTVSGTQSDLTYVLASDAWFFESTITVKNSSGESLGTLTRGNTTKIGEKYYTLDLDNMSNLMVTVSAAAPGPEPVTALPFFTGDFNGDLFDTLAVQKDCVVTIYQNGEPWGLGLTLDPGWTVVGTGDFNGDNLDDFLRVNTEGYVVGEMSNGNGTFSPQVLNLKNAGWDILGTGDFNGNGTSDVLIANPTGASETVGLLGYWESGVSWTLINGYSPEWECVSTGDFNGDGKCDMLWRNSFEGEGGLTYNAYCTWIVENPVDWRMVSVANPDEWNFLCSGDFDGNGSHDIAMINDVGVVGIWGV